MSELKPCPLCSDPMRWNTGRQLIIHVNQNPECPLGDLGFPEHRLVAWNTRPQPSAKPVDDLIEPLFSCSREGCREECSYPADMLRLHNGKPICDDCYGDLSFKEQAPDPDNEEETLMWSDLPPFVPPFAARIAALEVQLADAKTALIATGEATATHLKRATALEADNARLMGLVKEAGEVLGAVQQTVEDAAYCVKVDTPKTPFTEALNQIHEMADATLAKIKEATDGRVTD